jgi:predicted phage-related endonuclease
MKIITAVQGSPEWQAHRANHFNASDAPAMMGTGKFETRTELLHRLATGEVKEVSQELQRRFDDGHATEAQARPIVEELIGEELYPVVGVSDEYPRLSASFDGVTMDGSTGYEHKRWNKDLAESVRTGAIADDPAYWPQLEQQILVGSLQRVIFTVSDGTAEKMETYTYTPRPGRAQQLIAGWAQLEKDKAAYVPPAAKAAVVAAPVETLPAIICTVNRADMTVTHNLNEYRAAVDIIAERAKLPMVTDQDFADRKAVCKRLRDAEAALKAEAERLIGQMAEIAEAHRGLKDLAEVVRKLAIDGENKVAAEEKNRKQAVIDAGARALEIHVAALQTKFNGRVTMPAIKGNFAAATKNLRTIASFENAVDTELANRKIEANAVADLIATNLATLDELAPEHLFLFRDLQNLVTMPAVAFIPTVTGRVLEHKAKEEARLQAERERIAREEREKAEREARAKAEAEERARREEAQRQAQQQSPATPTAAQELPPQAPPVAAPVTTAPLAKTGGMREYAELRKRPTANEIVNLIATTYQVSAEQALEWLAEEFSTTADSV